MSVMADLRAGTRVRISAPGVGDTDVRTAIAPGCAWDVTRPPMVPVRVVGGPARGICPTSALHKQAYVVENGRVTEMWDITARDRVLTI